MNVSSYSNVFSFNSQISVEIPTLASGSAGQVIATILFFRETVMVIRIGINLKIPNKLSLYTTVIHPQGG